MEKYRKSIGTETGENSDGLTVWAEQKSFRWDRRPTMGYVKSNGWKYASIRIYNSFISLKVFITRLYGENKVHLNSTM